jgi:hypothetical protein
VPESDAEIDGDVEWVGYHVVANGVSVAVMLRDKDGVEDPHVVGDIVDTPLLAPGVSVMVSERHDYGRRFGGCGVESAWEGGESHRESVEEREVV